MPIPLETIQEFLTSAPVQQGFALAILAGAIYGFVSEKLPPDVTALLALLALMLTGVLTPHDAFSGFSHPATVSVAAVLVLSAGLERTGALTFLARRVLAPLGHSELLLTLVLMVSIAGLSAFINNTAAVAVFIPVVLEVCRGSGAAPGKLLMPMAHAATFGGMCTLIGTSTNLVAHEFARHEGLRGFSMFEIGQVGLPMLLAGFVYILVVGRWFLPRSSRREELAPMRSGAYVSEVEVMPESPWIGRELRPDKLQRDFEVELLQLMRDDEDITALDPRPRYEAGDRLRIRGPLERLLALAGREGLELHRPGGGEPEIPFAPRPLATFAAAAKEPEEPAEGEAEKPAEEAEPIRLPLTELVVLPGSHLIGRTLKSIRFAEHYDAVVLALHRPGGHVPERPGNTPIHAGDVLVVEGRSEALQALADMPGFLVAGTPTHPDTRPEKLWIALLTMGGVVLVVSLGLLPIVTAATAGCAVLMLTGCLTPREAYQAIDWSIVFVLAGALAMGFALEKTGITHGIATGLAHLTGLTGPYAVMAGFLVISIVLSEFMSNSGTVALLGPVAMSTAAQMGVNPMALLATVALGSSAAFAMPIGYQTSLMIYGPGGYRFRDYVKMGIPLDLMLAGLALWLIPRFWPLVGR